MQKIFVWLFALAFIISLGEAKCYYAHCASNISNAKSQTQSELTQDFNALKQELVLLKESYIKNLEQLKRNNEELERQLALKKNALLKEQEIVFLLQQFNQLQSNKNSLSAIKE